MYVLISMPGLLILVEYYIVVVTYISGHKMSSLVYALNFSLQLWILGSTGSPDGESNVPPIGWEDVRQIY